MKRHQIRSLYGILNKEDNKIKFQIRKEGQIKTLVRTFSNSIIVTAVIILTVFTIENPVFLMIGFMSVLFALFTYLFLVEVPKMQLKMWKGFF